MVPKDLKGLKKGFIKDQGVLQMVKVKLSWKVLLNYCFFVAPSLSYRFYVLQIQTPPLVVERQMNATKVFSHNSENNTVVFILVNHTSNKYKALNSTICFAIQNKGIRWHLLFFLKRLFNPSIQVLLATYLVLVACLVKCQVAIFLKCCQNSYPHFQIQDRDGLGESIMEGERSEKTKTSGAEIFVWYKRPR